MKKRYLILSALLLIQLIRFPKNNQPGTDAGMFRLYDVPEEVAAILHRSCTDCHSNRTRYRWYDDIAPLSWGVALHVYQGKKKLNFDKWNRYNKYQKQTVFDHLRESFQKNDMPPAGYLLFHKDALLTGKDRKILSDWFENLRNKESGVDNKDGFGGIFAPQDAKIVTKPGIHQVPKS